MRNLFLLSGVSTVALVLVACASSSPREAFVDEPPAMDPVTQTPEQSATPTKTTQSAPTETGDPDASVKPDAPDTCVRTLPSKKCGLVPQCGCTLAQTCDVQDNLGNVDCTTAGKAAMGAACIATAGCAVGLTCVFGTCHAFCNNPGSACTGAKLGGCLQVKDQTNAVIPNLSVCRVACDLRDVTACGVSSAAGTGVCQVDDAGNTDCAAGGTVAVGGVCSPTADCGAGLVCTMTGTATTGNCKKWCRVGTNDCGGAVVCNGFQTKIMVSGTEYGACP